MDDRRSDPDDGTIATPARQRRARARPRAAVSELQPIVALAKDPDAARFANKMTRFNATVAELRRRSSAGELESDLVALEQLSVTCEELKVAEEELVAQNEVLQLAAEGLDLERWRYQDLFESAPDGYIITDLQGIIRQGNQAAAMLLNVPQGFLPGKPLANFLVADNRRNFRGMLQRIAVPQAPVGSERIEWEVCIQPRRRAVVDAGLMMAAVRGRDGVATAIRWVLRDISGRKAAERALVSSNDRLEQRVELRTAELVASEERFRLMVEGAQDYAMMLLDIDGKVVFWSKGAERVFGYNEAEMVGGTADAIFVPEDRAMGVPHAQREAAIADGRMEVKRRHLRKDGVEIWVDGVMTPLRDERGHLRGLAMVGRDATATKSVEDELLRARAELEHRVIERTTELASANQALRIEVAERKQAEASRRELLRRLVAAQEEERRSISRELHDHLGQQLTALVLGLKALQPDERAGASDSRPGLADQVAHLERLVGDLMFQAHRLAWELRPAALDDLGLESALQRYCQDWTARTKLPLDFHSNGFGKERVPAEVETTLFRVVQEALTNVTRHACAKRVSVLLELRRSETLAIVEDDGEGFDVEQVSRASGDRRLGLVGMRERLTLVGGSLCIESSPGAGTTVFARIPMARGRDAG